MIVASGFVEVNGVENVKEVINEMKSRGLDVNDVDRVKIVFLLEGETIGRVKAELDSLKSIKDVSSVHLAYYSLEGEGDTADL